MFTFVLWYCFRLHRIGQQRPVTIHRFFIKDTIEDTIAQRQKKQRAMLKARETAPTDRDAERVAVKDIDDGLEGSRGISYSSAAAGGKAVALHDESQLSDVQQAAEWMKWFVAQAKKVKARTKGGRGGNE